MDPKFAYVLNGKGVDLEELKKYEQAIECFERYMQKESRLRNISYLNMGIISYGLGKYEDVKNFKRIDDSSLEAQKHNNAGICYYQLKLYEQARMNIRS